MNAFDRHFSNVREVALALRPSYPVYCLRPDEIRRSARSFLDAFPGRVLYAVKCNPHPLVLDALYAEGIRHFDTASLSEVALIRESFADATAYFMHPVKARAAIEMADDVYHVKHWVIDHVNELKKLVEVMPSRHGQAVLVRIATQAFGAAFELSNKFGATADEAVALLKTVADEGFQAGLAFHVGSQCRDPEAFSHAIGTVDKVLKASDVSIQYLDLGGGFPATYFDDAPPPLDQFIATIRDALESLDLRGDCVFMCEPGRALVASGCSLLTQVQLRKEDEIYLNDGVYHSLSEAGAHIRHPVRLLRLDGEPSSNLRAFKAFGPTCDCLDVIPSPVELPDDVREGDWIEFGQVGAYSNAMRTTFNGFYPETFVTVDEAPLHS